MCGEVSSIMYVPKEKETVLESSKWNCLEVFFLFFIPSLSCTFPSLVLLFLLSSSCRLSCSCSRDFLSFFSNSHVSLSL